MAPKVEAVFFDAGDTLIHPRAPLHELYAEVINREGDTAFDVEVVRRIMEGLGRELPRVLHGHFRYSDEWFKVYIRALLERLEFTGPRKGVTEGLFALFDEPSTFHVFPDAWPCLEALRKQGLKTAVISNWGFRLPRLLARLGLGDAFQAIVASADVRSEKPEPRIFQEALTRTATEPSLALHVGDDERNDLEGARGAGLQALLLDRWGTHANGDEKITSLPEVAAYI